MKEVNAYWSLLDRYYFGGILSVLEMLQGKQLKTKAMQFGTDVHKTIELEELAPKLCKKLNGGGEYEKWVNGNIGDFYVVAKIDYLEGSKIVEYKTGRFDMNQLYFYATLIPQVDTLILNKVKGHGKNVISDLENICRFTVNDRDYYYNKFYNDLCRLDSELLIYDIKIKRIE